MTNSEINMILSKQTIEKLIKEKKIKINPFDEKSIGTVSIDLHLDKIALDPAKNEEISLDNYYLTNETFILANALEFIELPANLIARIVPRSSLARLGVLATMDADILLPNFVGKPLFTLKNLTNKPILLKPGLAIAQIMFEEVDQEVETQASRYDTNKLEESKLCEELDNEKLIMKNEKR